ncbi:MAG TPA: hypothetical protein VMU62_03980, partial [Acidobacteriaceae bacterium]|nr:hypothetical protein [Acidobacteriaceae bacterium]
MATAVTTQLPVESGDLPILPAESSPARVTLKMQPIRKAAILMITLGDELARTMYPHFSEAELQRLTEEIASVRDVS